jgi:hypothetical protein
MFLLGLFGLLVLMIWVTWRLVLVLPAIFLLWFVFIYVPSDVEHQASQRQEASVVIDSVLSDPVNCGTKDKDLKNLNVIVAKTEDYDGPNSTDYRSRAKSKIWQIHRECDQ